MKYLRIMAQLILRSTNRRSLIVGCTSALLQTLLEQFQLCALSRCKVRLHLLLDFSYKHLNCSGHNCFLILVLGSKSSKTKGEVTEEFVKKEMVHEEVLSSVKEVKTSHSQMSVTQGQSLTLRASIPGASDVRWLLNGVELTNSEQYRCGVSRNEQTLTIRTVSKHEQGMITCEAQTQRGCIRCQFNTTVTAQQTEAPHFLVQPRSQNVHEGQNVKFTCEIAGEPSPEVEWLKDNMIVS